MEKYLSNSDTETKQIAANIAKQTQNNIFALSGELGAGKTTFVQGFAKGLGIKEKIISPTFVLIRQHKIPNTGGASGANKVLYHIDLYRIENISSLGLEEIWSDPNHIVLIEWAEKLSSLPKGTIRISIQKEDENRRKITLS